MGRADLWPGLAIGLVPLLIAAVAAACLPGFALSVDDVVSQLQPSISAAFRQLAAGESPLWSDHILGGMPLWGSGQIIHPATVLGHVVARLTGWQDSEVTTAYLFHLCAGTAAAWMFLRFHGCRRPAAAVGAVTFAFTGPFWGLWTNWNPYGWSATLVPALLLSVDVAVAHRGPLRSAWREVCFAAVCGAVILVICDPQLIVKQALLVGSYFLLRADRDGRRHAAMILGLAALLAAACGLAQCLAVREYVGQTTRVSAAGVHPDDFFFMSVPAAALAGLVDPFVVVRWLGFGRDHLYGAAITIGPLVPVLAGVVLDRAWWRRSVTRSLTIIFAAVLLLCIGRGFPPSELLLRVPIINNFRWPIRWMLEGCTVGALLVGFGTDLVLRRLARRDAGPLAARCACLFAALWCLRAAVCDWPQAAGSIGWLAAGSVAVVGMLVAARLHARPSTVAWLAAAAVGLAVVGGAAALPVAQRQRFADPDLRNLVDAPLEIEVGPQERVWPCLPIQLQRELTSGGNLVYGMPRQFDVRTVGGYAFPLRWQTWGPFLGLQGQIRSFPAFRAAVLDPARPGLLHLLRVGAIVVAAADDESRRLLDAHPDFTRQDATAQLVVYRHGGFRATAWFVTELVGVPPGPVPFPDIDTKRTAVAIVPGATAALRRSFAAGATVNGFNERHGRIDVDVACPAAGLLVINATFYPGWEARVDGRPAEVRLVNGGFMGVEVPAGTTKVELRYAPRWLVVVIFFSLAAWLAVHALFIGWVLPDWVRRLAGREEPATVFGSRLGAAVLLPLVLTFVAYLPSMHGPFVFDGVGEIVRNQGLRTLWPPWVPMLTGGQLPQRPIPYYSFALNRAACGLAPLGWHLVNVAIHLGNGLLAWFVVREIVRRTGAMNKNSPAADAFAWATATLWLVHPACTQAVSYVYQRIELLAAACILAALACQLRGDRAARPLAWRCGSIVACGVGMLCKESAAAAPLLLLLVAWLGPARRPATGHEPDRRPAGWTTLAGTLRADAPYWAALAATWLVAAAVVFVQRDRFGEFARPKWTPLEYALQQPRAILRYLQLAVWPAGQCVDYGWTRLALAWTLPGWIAVAGLAAGFVRAVGRRPDLAIAIGGFLILLGPTSSLLPVIDLCVEHRMYLPLLPLVAVFVGLLAAAVRRLLPAATAPPAFGAVVIACAATLAAVSFARNGVWSSAARLWEDALAKAPANPRAAVNVAGALLQEQRFAEAAAVAAAGLAVEPEPDGPLRAALLTWQARGRRGAGDSAAAVLPLLDAAIAAAPRHAEAHFERGSMLMETDPLEAERSFARAITIDPGHANACNNLAGLLVDKDLPAAIELMGRAVAAAPERVRFRLNLARLLARGARPAEAAASLRAALELRPTAAERAEAEAALAAARTPADDRGPRRP